jgi:hypothetical protein
MDLRDEFIRLACVNLQARSHSPDSGSFQFSQKVNGRPSFMAIANGSFGLAVLRHSLESVRWNQAAPFLESLPIRGRFIDYLSSRIDGPVSDLWIFCPIWN